MGQLRTCYGAHLRATYPTILRRGRPFSPFDRSNSDDGFQKVPPGSFPGPAQSAQC